MSLSSADSATATPKIGVDGLPVAEPFDLHGRTVLITGGAAGLGWEFVEQFLKHGAKTIIITGRRESVLKEAQAKHPQHIHYFVSDAAKAAERQKLFEDVSKQFPELSVLVNNAGILRYSPLAAEKAAWEVVEEEILINYAAPIHLSHLFAPLLLKQKNGGAILHFTSGLGYIPFANGPVYGGTKAALHSFAIAQRISFQGTSVRVVEIVPPQLRTALTNYLGEDPVEFAASVFARWTAGELEVGFKMSEEVRKLSRVELIQRANFMGTKVPKYQNA